MFCSIVTHDIHFGIIEIETFDEPDHIQAIFFIGACMHVIHFLILGIKFVEFLDQVITGELVEVAMLLFLLEVVSDLDSRK